MRQAMHVQRKRDWRMDKDRRSLPVHMPMPGIPTCCKSVRLRHPQVCLRIGSADHHSRAVDDYIDDDPRPWGLLPPRRDLRVLVFRILSDVRRNAPRCGCYLRQCVLSNYPGTDHNPAVRGVLLHVERNQHLREWSDSSLLQLLAWQSMARWRDLRSGDLLPNDYSSTYW